MRNLQWTKTRDAQGNRMYDLRDRKRPPHDELQGTLMWVPEETLGPVEGIGEVKADPYYTFVTYGDNGSQYDLRYADTLREAKIAAESIVYLNGTDLRD